MIDGDTVTSFPVVNGGKVERAGNVGVRVSETEPSEKQEKAFGSSVR